MLQVDNDKHQHRQGETHLYKNVPRNHHKKKKKTPAPAFT